MSIKNELIEKYSSLSSEKEVKLFLNEVVTALHEINNISLSVLVNEGALSEERSSIKQEQTDTLLKQIVENIFENVKFYNLTVKAKSYEAAKKENEILASKVERAKELLSEKDAEIEKAKKSTRNELKKKLQLGRDRIIAIAETSSVLGERINDDESIDILNNIRDNVGLLTDELLVLGLWDADEVRPYVEPLTVKATAVNIEKDTETDNVGEPLENLSGKKTKKTSKKKAAKKAATEPEDEIDSFDDFDSLDVDSPKKIKSSKKKTAKSVAKEVSQISLLDVVDDNSQEN